MFKKGWLILTTASALALTACGGDSSNDSSKGSGDIDLRSYFIPSSTTTLTYEEYYVGNDVAFQEGSYTESWQVFANSAILSESDYDDNTITFDGSNITFNIDGYDLSNSLPRFVNAGSIYQYSMGGEFIVFGPENSKTITIPGTNVSRTGSNVITLIERNDDDEVGVVYAAQGVGVIASYAYWDCPTNIQLSPTIDYGERCGFSYDIEILIN